MCGRFALIAVPDEIANIFALADLDPFPARYNIAPTQPVLVVRAKARPEGSNLPDREPMLVRWGLWPSWMKDPKGFPTLINARSESAHEKPAFRAAMRHRRVLFPASGFYEWKRAPGGKALQAYFVHPRQGDVVAFAGVMETWTGPNGEEVDTAAILTAPARGDIASVHDRMPVAIEPENFSRWLDCTTQEPRDVADLFAATPDDFYAIRPVSSAVNKVANSGPELLDEVTPLAEADKAPPMPAKGQELRDEQKPGADQLKLF